MFKLNMKGLSVSLIYIVSLLALFPANLPQSKTVMAQPLNTSGKWIVDQSGKRVKFACVNWATHLEAMVAEGLNKQPIDEIALKIKLLGFNCVRLTWPTYLVTDSSARITVRESLLKFNLIEAIAGVQANNPSILNLQLLDAFKVVVTSLTDKKLMVILDNHVSKPGWCCSLDDGNGFFGDKYFNVEDWIRGLDITANLFVGNPYVVGMSLRNALRGPNQTVNGWLTYMVRGAKTVSAANPNVLVIFSGLNGGTDFSFLVSRGAEFRRAVAGLKIVFEVYWYDTDPWATENANDLCDDISFNIFEYYSRRVFRGIPLFVSIWTWDQTGTDANDNKYLNCLLGIAARDDWDWAYLTVVGSYYIKEGTIGYDENHGILDWNWCGVRNTTFMQRISFIQTPHQGPGLEETSEYQIIYHPSTGLCVLSKWPEKRLILGPCLESEAAWNYSSEGILSVSETYCLQANGVVSTPTQLGILCSASCSKWTRASASKFHLSTMLTNGTTVCMDKGPNNTVVTNSCRCLKDDPRCDPTGQWFVLVSSTRSKRTGPYPPASPQLPINGCACSM